MAIIITKPSKAASRQGVLAGGNWILDQVKVVDVFPQPERLANIQSRHQGTGGAPYNVLLDLAKLGAAFPLLGAGLVGDDDAGRAILADCAAHQVDCRFLKTTPKAATSFTDVMTEAANGRRTFFHFRGANALWDGADLDFAKTKARLFHLGYLLLLDALDGPDKKWVTRSAALLQRAQEAGLKTSVDLVSEDSDRFAKVVHPALKFTDYLIINEIEAGKTSGFKIRQPDGRLDTVSLRHAAGALLQLGVKETVVIHFPEGAFARTRKGEDVWQSSLKVPAKDIKGTAGAGDAFCAGTLYGLHEGWELTKSLQTGVAAAAACLQDATCTGGLRPLAACQALTKKYGFRPALEPED
jgi:sugar/nucleoside kinase (ribokinase family)